MLFSDRDLYRPGEAMHLEAIVREWGDQGLTVPVGTDRHGAMRGCARQTLLPNQRGVQRPRQLVTLVPLPTASRGSYTATLHFGTNDSSQDARPREDYQRDESVPSVQDFKPSAFEIQLPCKEEYAAGEPVLLPLSARYLFGKSVSRAQVAWSLEANDMDFQPEQFQAFSFRRSNCESRYGRGRSSLP